MSSAYERIYAVVARIPRGKVATYGQVARLAGMPRHARQAGYALFALPEGHGLPWQRVVNAKGEVSARSLAFNEAKQRALLEREGVAFDAKGRIPLKRFQWKPGTRP
ncbi:MAG: MGMT family protein [Elusimicrobiota bacterium]|nr:MGMT family protein [Elusimicrobiota bacterium]